MTQNDYNKMLENQNNACAICKKKEDNLNIDHDKTTNKVRGLLCNKCNTTLSILNYKTTDLLPMSIYLIRAAAQNWDQYFINIAMLVASRSKDKSTQVGAVIVKNRIILSTGYNGFPRGINDDDQEKHERPEKYIWTIHAEENAILNAAKNGIKTDKATLYVSNMHPCTRCATSIVQSGIVEVIHGTTLNPRWDDEIKTAQKIFSQSGVTSRPIE